MKTNCKLKIANCKIKEGFYFSILNLHFAFFNGAKRHVTHD